VYEREFLDKLFQATLRIPPLLEPDRSEFISKCLSQLSIPMPAEATVRISEVLTLAYKGQTPRQVKRFVNDFAMQYVAALGVEKSDGRLGSERPLTRDVTLFAFVTALFQVWPRFRDELRSQPDLLHRLQGTFVAKGRIDAEGMKSSGLRDELCNEESLSAFLNACLSWAVLPVDLSVYVYLKPGVQEKIRLSAVKEALISGDKTFWAKLGDGDIALYVDAALPLTKGWKHGGQMAFLQNSLRSLWRLPMRHAPSAQAIADFVVSSLMALDETALWDTLKLERETVDVLYQWLQHCPPGLKDALLCRLVNVTPLADADRLGASLVAGMLRNSQLLIPRHYDLIAEKLSQAWGNDVSRAFVFDVIDLSQAANLRDIVRPVLVHKMLETVELTQAQGPGRVVGALEKLWESLLPDEKAVLATKVITDLKRLGVDGRWVGADKAILTFLRFMELEDFSADQRVNLWSALAQRTDALIQNQQTQVVDYEHEGVRYVYDAHSASQYSTRLNRLADDPGYAHLFIERLTVKHLAAAAKWDDCLRAIRVGVTRYPDDLAEFLGRMNSEEFEKYWKSVLAQGSADGLRTVLRRLEELEGGHLISLAAGNRIRAEILSDFAFAVRPNTFQWSSVQAQLEKLVESGYEDLDHVVTTVIAHAEQHQGSDQPVAAWTVSFLEWLGRHSVGTGEGYGPLVMESLDRLRSGILEVVKTVPNEGPKLLDAYLEVSQNKPRVLEDVLSFLLHELAGTADVGNYSGLSTIFVKHRVHLKGLEGRFTDLIERLLPKHQTKQEKLFGLRLYEGSGVTSQLVVDSVRVLASDPDREVQALAKKLTAPNS
jgi:hypothetical protein